MSKKDTSKASKPSLNPDWFTGKIRMKDVTPKSEQKKMNIYHVRFPDGSRTKLHSHNGIQILLVSEGSGSVVTYKATSSEGNEFNIKKVKTTKLNKGDMACILPDTLHTHGSTSKTKEFSHFAINKHPENSKFTTEWFESDFKTRVFKMI